MVTFTKLKAFIGLIGIGSEVAMYAEGSAPSWVRWIVLLFTVLAGSITIFIEDKNNDGIADVFQRGEDLK